MSTKRVAPPPLICVHCGDEHTIPAMWLPTGPVCSECGPEPEAFETSASPETNQPKIEVSTPRATESKGESAAAAPGDRAATPSIEEPTDPWSFRPAPEAMNLTVEVEEWIYYDPDRDWRTAVPVANPREVFLSSVEKARCVEPMVAFVVVLEWSTHAKQRVPFREVGRRFMVVDDPGDREFALRQAREFGKAEARRLKTVCIGYHDARSFEVQG